MSNESKTISIDCPPQNQRPDYYLKKIIEGTGLEYREPYSKFFGNWSWDYSDLSDKLWAEVYEILHEGLNEVYSSGGARYISISRLKETVGE